MSRLPGGTVESVGTCSLDRQKRAAPLGRAGDKRSVFLCALFIIFVF